MGKHNIMGEDSLYPISKATQIEEDVRMIIENTGIKGAKSELSHLDAVMEKANFIRWQWELNRATYDYEIDHKETGDTYYLRVNARVLEGKLENPFAVLEIGDAYIGRATFPHGLDYASPIPKPVMDEANRKPSELKRHLA